MNKRQRQRLSQVWNEFENYKEILEENLELEQEKIDNAPENLIYSEKYEKIQDGIDQLETIIYSLDEVISELECLCSD